MSDWLTEISVRCEETRKWLAEDAILGEYVDLTMPIPQPFVGSGEIKLVVIGQDPTVQRRESRSRITTVLNLNISGSLTRYLDSICTQVGIKRQENLYATNACKNFFTDPPTTIQKQHHVNVIQKSASYWLPLLRLEIAMFPQAIVISLGEPVLSLLVRNGGSRLMKFYWGYSKNWQQSGKTDFASISPANSTIDRQIFPFPHQPSLRKAFYRERLPQYIDFLCTQVDSSTD